jgi:hypothetical protein
MGPKNTVYCVPGVDGIVMYKATAEGKNDVVSAEPQNIQEERSSVSVTGYMEYNNAVKHVYKSESSEL